MDPLTHALAGATVAWAVSGARLGRRALVIGAAAGLAPDLDILIRSASDPLLAIEHHRGFTHSFAFAPAGGAIVAAILGARGKWRWSWLAALLAWISHALLDASTTYGTQLFWPFSRHRVGLDIISIIDPLFTLALLAGVIAAMRDRPRFVHGVLAFAIVWLAIGLVQRERALAAQRLLAAGRGESVERGAVFPTVGNTLVWRSLYVTNGTLRMDRIRVPWFRDPVFTVGPFVPHVVAHAGSARERRDFARFAWFSDDWLAADPEDPTVIGDARYSVHTDRYRPVWAIRLHPARTEWIDRTPERARKLRRKPGSAEYQPDSRRLAHGHGRAPAWLR